MGITWAIFWWFLTFETPGKHPHITEHERIYIETCIGENTSILSEVCGAVLIIYSESISWTFRKHLNILEKKEKILSLSKIPQTETAEPDHFIKNVRTRIIVFSITSYYFRSLCLSNWGVFRWLGIRHPVCSLHYVIFKFYCDTTWKSAGFKF